MSEETKRQPLSADTPDKAGRGLRGKLRSTFLLQIGAISLAMLLSVLGAWVVLRDVLIKRALIEESQYFSARLSRDANAPVPDVYNMRGYIARRQGPDALLPVHLRPLTPGYHVIDMGVGADDLVYVSETAAGRLYLVFDQKQVDRLALWFGFVPLIVVLGVIYSASWLSFRTSKRMVSPIVRLAEMVQRWDPRHPDLDAIAPGRFSDDSEHEVHALATALHNLGTRVEKQLERELNFTRDASHELRTPLTVIKLAADSMLAEDALDPYVLKSAQRIRRAARDIEALIESFLILARESDVGLPDEDFVVNDVVGDEAERAEMLVTGKPVEIRVIENARFALHAPSRVFSVMLSNLLRNACLYTQEGSVTIVVDRDRVSVIDTGKGMSPEVIARAWDAFDRGGRIDSDGFGLGLTIVRRLSDRFGWPVHLDSEPGRGTRAVIHFPEPQAV